MADELDEAVVIADDDSSTSEDVVIKPLKGEDEEDVIAEELLKPEYQEESIQEEKKRKKRVLILGIGAGALSLIIVILIVLIIKGMSDKKNQDTSTKQIVDKIQKKEKFNTFTPSKIDTMIQRANALYEKGNKLEALDIYENIATYNEAISQYNIGVAKMKEEDFKGALDAFKNAILNKEKRTVSAINGAVCALRLNDMPLFKYYLDLAYTYLPEENNSPLYSYYFGLINFYRGNYYEALSALTHQSSKDYLARQNYISSKIYTFLDSPYFALESLQSQNQIPNTLSKGLLYAKIGEYSLAKNELEKSITRKQEPERASLALALVNLKLGNFEDSAKGLRAQFEANKTRTIRTYPIKTTLNNALFDINIAQKKFKENDFFDKKNQYAMIFYFAPYKVFDAKQTINFIRKGGMNVFVDEIKTGLDYLKTSSTISKINISLSKGIKTALNHHYLKANREFKSLIKIYSKHAILHYNLALTYAQLGNYSLSYKHFNTSYRLDPTNYLSGLFAVMSAQLIGKDYTKLFEDVKKNIDSDESIPRVNFYMTLAHSIENNQFSMNRWLEIDKSDMPLNLVFDIITANLVSNTKAYLEKSQQLQKILPKDMLANIIAFNARYGNLGIKEYAKMIQIKFKSYDFDMASFYYGANAVKEQYIKMLQISGLLYKERDTLKKELEIEQNDVIGIMQALAYLDIYTNNFEEAYALYNSLIDEHDQQDTNTIFLGAVASIGANHPENAIALLELSKLIDPNNLESRYGLGLLYQQTKNYNGAATQYENIGNNGFISKYFSFEITN